MRSLLPTTLALAAMLCLPGEAAATAVPPGLSGANQYSETLPGPSGDESTHNFGGNAVRGTTPSEVLGRGNATRLEALGAAGAAAARLAARTAPRDGAAGSSRGGSAADPRGSSAAGQILGQVTGASDSGRMGLLLPLLIALGAAAAITFVLGRRRMAPDHD